MESRVRWKSHARFGGGENSEITSKNYLFPSIEQFQNIFPARISILSTKKTKEQKLADRYLPDYTVIYPNYVCDESIFIDSVRMNNAYLDAIGGD